MVRPVATASGNSSSPSSAESSFRELDEVFLQTQTRIWLGEVLQTRMDEHLNISDLLADGELLFQVSKVIFNLLLEKCVELRHINVHKNNPIISRKSSGRYKPYSNVDSFLKICKILGLNGIDLFSPSDVVEKRDTRKVCICIRALSKKARSKQLNIPDFDMVTYTVTMPTSLVGCLRRSLERSQCSFQSSSYSFYNSSKLKLRQKNSAAVCNRNYDSCSEESDEAESRYVGAERFSLCASNYDDTALLYSDLENSAGPYPVVRRLPSVKQFEHDQCNSARSTEFAASLSTHIIKHDLDKDTLDNFSMKCTYGRAALEYDVDHCLENDESVVADSLDDNGAEMSYLSNGLAFSDLIALATDGSSPVLFDEEDMFNIHMSSDSFGSSAKRRTSQNGVRSRYSDDIEDVEISSTDSMSSVLGRMLNLDFDDQFNERDFRTTKGSYTRLLDNEADRVDRSSDIEYRFEDMDECESSMHGITPETNEPHIKTKFQKIGFSTECLSICPDDWQSYCIEHQGVELFNNKSGISQRDSGKILLLEDMDFAISKNNGKIINKENNDIGDTMFKSDTDMIEEANNHFRAECCDAKNIAEDSNALCSAISVGGREERPGNLHNQDVITRDAHGQGTPKPALVAVDDSVIDPNFVICVSQCGPASEMNPCSTAKGSENADTTDCQPCEGHNKGLFYCVGHVKKDAEKLYQDVLVEENQNKKQDTTVAPPKDKPSRKSLLKTVAKGTALVGALFLLLHIRNRSGRENTHEDSKQPNQIHKSSGSKFSSQKEQKGARMNGIYPGEKLKFGS